MSQVGETNMIEIDDWRQGRKRKTVAA